MLSKELELLVSLSSSLALPTLPPLEEPVVGPKPEKGMRLVGTPGPRYIRLV